MADKKETKKKGTSGIVKYFKDVRGELKKVVWPSFKQVKNNTIIVLIVVILVGLLIWALDFAFGSLVGLVVDKNNPAQTETIDASDLTVGEDGTVNMDGIQLVDENGNPIDADVVTEGAEVPAEGEEAATEEAAAETEAEAETTDETAGADE